MNTDRGKVNEQEMHVCILVYMYIYIHIYGQISEIAGSGGLYL
jgi:hypothetical protein